MLVEADCTGLLLYENESQMLHGLWKSTQFSDSGPEVRAAEAQIQQSSSTCDLSP